MQPILAHDYAGQDPRGWLVSEKLDGVRAVWNRRQVLSRNGNLIPAPDWFTEDLPDLALDGELWAGRGGFRRVLAAIQSPNPSLWDGIGFHVFDAPKSRQGFADRLAVAAAAIAGCHHARIVEHVPCRDRAHLETLLESVIAGGGEGIILRKATAPYIPFRSASFLRYKRTETADS